jgi:hypothetical protein
MLFVLVRLLLAHRPRARVPRFHRESHSSRVGSRALFETSSWNLRNRRSWKVLERLAELAGTGPVLAYRSERMPPGLSEAQRALALAEAGEYALTFAIETAANPGESRRGKARRIWKAMTPETGARAAIFFTHGLAETTAKLASAPGHHLSPARQSNARSLLRSALPWSDEEEEVVQRQAARIDPETAQGAEGARVWLAFHAVSMIVGDETAAGLPGFAVLEYEDDLDRLLAGHAWQMCFSRGTAPYLGISDEEGMDRWRRRQRGSLEDVP